MVQRRWKGILKSLIKTEIFMIWAEGKSFPFAVADSLPINHFATGPIEAISNMKL